VIITVDGPSGSGKGTLCQLLAAKLGYHLLDSGALYRLTALAVSRAGVPLSNESAVAAVARDLPVVFKVSAQGQSVILQGADVSADIRREEVGMLASQVAAMPSVRAALLQRQRAFVEPPGLVADGRDMGTIVFPEAEVKVFLTASSQERARRRFLQLQEAQEQGKGESPDMAMILADIEDRDARDRSRAASPLVPATDALQIDSSAMPIDAVLVQVLAKVSERLASFEHGLK